MWKKAITCIGTTGNPGSGSIYGLPKDIGPFALAYNKDMFDAAGVTAPTRRALDVGRVRGPQEADLGTGADKILARSVLLESAVWSNGADWLNGDHTEVTVTDPRSSRPCSGSPISTRRRGRAASRIRRHCPHYQRFVDGKVGMMGHRPMEPGRLWNDVKFDWDFMPWPVSPRTGERGDLVRRDRLRSLQREQRQRRCLEPRRVPRVQRGRPATNIERVRRFRT